MDLVEVLLVMGERHFGDRHKKYTSNDGKYSIVINFGADWGKINNYSEILVYEIYNDEKTAIDKLMIQKFITDMNQLHYELERYGFELVVEVDDIEELKNIYKYE